MTIAAPRGMAVSAGHAPSWPSLIWIGGLILLGLSAPLPAFLNDADIYWHVATGQLILDSHALPTVDPFSHTMAGRPWVVHEWLAQVAMAAAYRLGGWPGLALLAPLASAVTSALLARALMRTLSWRPALIVTVLALITMLPHMLARPHVLAWPLLVLWTAELAAASDGRRSPPWWLLGVMVLWANLHGSFVLGLGLAGFAAAEVALAASLRHRRLVVHWPWAGFVGLAVAASLLTPHGLGKIVYVFEVMGQSVQLAQIGEWRSPNFQQPQPLQLWLFAFLAVALSIGLRVPPLRLLMLLGLLHLGLRHVRYVELVGLLAPLYLAVPLAAHLPASPDGAIDARLAPLARRLLHPLPAVLLAAFVALVAAGSLLKEIAPAAENRPEAALAAVRAAGIVGPVFNDYDFGGYLIAQGVPTFIDGRSDLYGDAFLAGYLDAIQATEPQALQQLLDRHQATWTLLHPARPSAALLDHLPGWRRLYADDGAVVHVRLPPGT